MNRTIVNTAALLGMLTFVVSLVVHLLVTPATRGGRDVSLTGPPVENALVLIADAHATDRYSHDVWRHVTTQLLREDEPIAALVELDQRVPGAHRDSHAAGGFASYYLGFELMNQDRPEAAAAAWEIGLESFRGASSPRPWLNGQDTLYEARTLMRLGRNDEANRVLDRLEASISGSEMGPALETAILRTMAETGREAEASARFAQMVAGWPETDRARTVRELTNQAAQWRGAREPMAAIAALKAAVATYEAILRDGTPVRGAFDLQVRTLGLQLQASRLPGLATEVWRRGEAEAVRRAEAGGDPNDWRWAAKYRGLLGDGAGAAKAIVRASEGPEAEFIDPDGLVRDPDLIRHMALPEMRAAVRRFGEPSWWPGAEGDTDESP